MPVGYADTGTAAAVGYDASADLASSVNTATASAVGYAALGIGAAPDTSSAPDALRLEIVSKDGTQLVPDLPRRNLSFLVEHNGSGFVNFEMDLDALPEGVAFDPDNPSNLARVHFGDLPAWPYGVAEGVAMSAPPSKDEKSGGWALQVACPGSGDLLGLGLLWPPAGATGNTREFSYTAGMTGPSWVPAQWGKPYGYNVKSSWRWREHRWPRGWPESKAQWLGLTSPEKKSPNGKQQFSDGTFTLTAKGDVRFHTAGDDTLRLYMNGALLKKKPKGAWHTTTTFTRTLKAGTYKMASEVANLPGTNNRTGFLLAVELLKANGEHDRWLLRSKTDTFKVRKSAGYIAQVPLPPDGWYPAAVLHTHIGECAARGVDFHPEITLTFSTTHDSSGSAWTAKGPAEYDLSISGADLAEKIRAGSVDVAMLPGLRQSAWKSRGFDLRDRVVVSAPMGHGWTSRAWPRVRTVGLTHHESGWAETVGDVAGPFGRREMALSGGGVDGDLQADVFAAQALATAASPEETIEWTVSTADMVGEGAQPMPFRDYNVADVVSAETIGEFTPVKVMSIAGAEQGDGSVVFRIAGYPV